MVRYFNFAKQLCDWPVFALTSLSEVDQIIQIPLTNEGRDIHCGGRRKTTRQDFGNLVRSLSRSKGFG